MRQKAVSIGQNLKRLRQVSGLTQGQVASALGVSYQQIQKYESGGNRLTAEKLFELKEFYNVPYEMFFEGINEPDKAHICPGNRKAELFSKLNGIQDKGLRDKVERVVLVFLE